MMLDIRRYSPKLAVAAILFSLVACDGGGASFYTPQPGDPAPPPPPPPTLVQPPAPTPPNPAAFGATFQAAFSANPNAEPIDPQPGDVPARDKTAAPADG